MYELHTLYYLYWKEREAMENMSKEEKTAMAIGEAMGG